MSEHSPLTESQIKEAKSFYNKHKEHVDKIVAKEPRGFIPVFYYDKSNPGVWKPAHWKWFLESGL